MVGIGNLGFCVKKIAVTAGRPYLQKNYQLLMSAVLTIDRLTKFYGPIKALDEVSFEVPRGSVFGILGPNGSGKTTLLGIVMDIIKASSGSFRFFGHEASAADRRQMGTLLETPNFYHYLSGERNLRIAAEIKGKGMGDIEAVLKKVNLYERRKSKFSTYSLGMKQRLAIASCLLGDPEVLVFDEPTNGLDPAGIAEIRELMKRLYAEGKTIIMASHILDEVEKVCTHVAIIQKGVLKRVDTVDRVLAGGQGAGQRIEIAVEGNMDRLQQVVGKLAGVVSVQAEEGLLVVDCATSLSPADLNQHCFDNGLVLTRLGARRQSLESTFLELTGKVSER